MKTKLIESTTLAGLYDMDATIAIVDHPTHGRLLLCDGFGGMDEPRGGMYRWEHGVVCQLHPDDTLADLEADWNDFTTIREAVITGHDDSRPILEWTGSQVAALAKSAGL